MNATRIKNLHNCTPEVTRRSRVAGASTRPRILLHPREQGPLPDDPRERVAPAALLLVPTRGSHGPAKSQRRQRIVTHGGKRRRRGGREATVHRLATRGPRRDVTVPVPVLVVPRAAELVDILHLRAVVSIRPSALAALHTFTFY